MFPWVILQLWSLAWAFSVLFGAKTPTELVSVFVLLHCQNSSAESVQKQDMKALNTHRHTLTCTHIKSVSFWNTYTCKHTLSISLFLSQTHTFTNAHTQKHWCNLLWSYILFAVSGCAGWLASLWMHLHCSNICVHACISLCVFAEEA